MNDLFNNNDFRNNKISLSEKLRPAKISDFIGQTDLFSADSLLRKMIEDDNLSSFILWGPPGVGKTSIANIISKTTKNYWKSFSAVISGIKEVKEIMENSDKIYEYYGKKTILFIDEIHRFNKAQQDAFLPYVEKGRIILIGATTENPSFSIISPLLSRMRIFILKPLTDKDIENIIIRTINFLEKEEKIKIYIEKPNINKIINISSGDARRAIGIIEMSLKLCKNYENKIIIDNNILEKVIQGRVPNYDKNNDYHYDYISALHKSMRNSDVDASIYYTVKMLESGEDPLYIIRRVIQFSSEDIGLADPDALIISINAREAILSIGMPEAKLAILQSVVYNALAPKSNSLLEAYNKAKEDIDNFPDLQIPLQIRNAPTQFMKDIGYGKDYLYAHNYEIPVTKMICLPEKLKDREYYIPTNFGFEEKLKKRLEKIKNIKKN